MHCLTEADWTTRYRPVMDVPEEAKRQGIIRAHDLVRINPIGAHMDADRDTVVSVIRQMKASGKGVIGMKSWAKGTYVIARTKP